MAGIFCGCVATLISTLWVVLFWVVPAHAVHDLKALLSVAFSILFFAFVPAGLFGFVCGVIGRLYLLVRSAHIATTVCLISGCGIIGVLFSLCFPLFLPDDKQQTRRHPAWISRKLRLLRAHALITKIVGTHRYQLTSSGRRIIVAILSALRSTVAQLTPVTAQLTAVAA